MRKQQLNYNSRNSNDWHRADIIAAVKKTGTSIRRLSLDNGLAESTLSNTLDRHWPKGERIIATTIGVEPAEIWPSRYEVNITTDRGTRQKQVA